MKTTSFLIVYFFGLSLSAISHPVTPAEEPLITNCLTLEESYDVCSVTTNEGAAMDAEELGTPCTGPFTSGVTISGHTGSVCPGTDLSYSLTVPGGHQSGYVYEWDAPVGWYIWGSGNHIVVSVPYTTNTSGGYIRCRVNNGCGWSGAPSKTVYSIPFCN